jgi:hypothetical protein
VDNPEACTGFCLKFTRPTDFFSVDNDKLKNLLSLLVPCSACSVRFLRHSKAIPSLEKKKCCCYSAKNNCSGTILNISLKPKIEI